MTEQETPYLHGATTLLRECHETMEELFARFERAQDARTKRKIVEAALHELKVHATIEELILHPALTKSESRRRYVQNLAAELESMRGPENDHDARFEALAAGMRRHIREEEPLFARRAPDDRPRGLVNGMRRPAAAVALVTLLAAVIAGAQSNQGGGEQINPNTSLNSIISGGSTGIAAPVDTMIVPVTPASDETAPASNEKDHPLKRPLPVNKPPVKKKLSDRALAKKIRREIRDDSTLPPGSQDVKVAAASGTVTLTGTVLNEDDEYKIAAKAAELVGVDHVVNLITVKPAAAP